MSYRVCKFNGGVNTNASGGTFDDIVTMLNAEHPGYKATLEDCGKSIVVTSSNGRVHIAKYSDSSLIAHCVEFDELEIETIGAE